MLVSEEDDLQVELVPRIPQEEILKFALRLHDVNPVGFMPNTVRFTLAIGIYWIQQPHLAEKRQTQNAYRVACICWYR